MKRKHNVAGIALLVSGMAVFGSATPVSKLVGEHFPVFAASLLRVMLGALALLPFVARDLRAQMAAVAKRDWLWIALIAVFGMVGFTVLLLYGMKFISGVAGSVVMAFTPALTAAAAVVFLHAPMDWRRALAVALGVAGVVVMNLFKSGFGASGEDRFYLGVALVIGAISCEAAYTLLGKKVTQHLPPIMVSFLACVLSLPLFTALALLDVGEFQFSTLEPTAWAALLWWGIGTLGAGSALWYSGLARTEGTTAAGFMAVMPVSALLLSYFLLDEPFRWIHLPGIALVLCSVGVMSWVHVRSETNR